MSLPNITVCCCTYRRPRMLEYVLYCFEQQDYPFRSMVILDDAGQLEEAEGNRWRVVSVDKRYPTLGEKRNACAKMVPKGTEVLVFWDDDDLFLPWGLSATAEAMSYKSHACMTWARPGLFNFLTKTGELWRCRTWNREDQKDKACQCGWGIGINLFNATGYPALNVGEDKRLAMALEQHTYGQEEDSTSIYPPWYIWGPWDNEHISNPKVVYNTFDGGVGKNIDGKIRVQPKPPPGIDIHRPVFLPEIGPRPFKGDWYEDVER